MRIITALLFTLLLPGTAFAQAARVAFVLDAKPLGGDVGSVLNQRAVTRAWQDSVDVLIDHQSEQTGLQRVAPNDRASYLMQVIALPIILQGQPTGLTTYSMTFFETGSFGSWKYLANHIGYSGGAAGAAGQIVELARKQIAERQRGNR